MRPSQWTPIAWAILPLVLCACRETGPARLCLASDLGGFQPIAVAAEGEGCLARYRDQAGREATARVAPAQPGQPEGTPTKFEGRQVRVVASPAGVRIAWRSGSNAVSLTLQGGSRPEGPVLRAYLYNYPSDLQDEIASLERDIELLREQSALLPQDGQTHLELARTYRKLGKNVLADYEYKFALDRDPRCYPCLIELGTLMRELRHWDLAIRAFRRAAEVRPQDPEAWLLLGDVSFEVRNRLEALRGYEEALERGLGGEAAARARERLAELRAGKFMLEMAPGALRAPDAGTLKTR